MSYTKYLSTSLTILAIGLGAIICSAQSGTAWQTKVDPTVLAKAENGMTVDFLIVLNQQVSLKHNNSRLTKSEKGRLVFDQLYRLAQKSQAGLIHLLKSEGAHHHSFFIINAIYCKGDLDLIHKIAQRNDVAQLQANPSVRLEEPQWQHPQTITTNNGDQPLAATPRTEAEWGIQMIGADKVWDRGITGNGVVVGGQDTGYKWDHPALKDKYRGWNGTTADHNYNWHDAIHEISLLHNDSIVEPTNNPCGLDAPEPCDDHNHGTHTMGTMVGSAPERSIGVAPGAKWMACRNMERGYGSPVTYIECFEWLLAPTDLNNENPDPSKAPHVINNSWSCPEMEGCNENNWTTMEKVVDNLKAAGVVVVVSAGNSGSQGCETVSAPAAMFNNSFTIGATASNDTIAGFSSRGPVGVDGSGRLKPNVVAPGVAVLSSFKDDNYGFGSGTSMAGPHTAGAVALIISANPDLAGQVEAIEKLLESTAVAKTAEEDCGDLSGNSIPNNTYGYGRIDVLAAVEKALAMKEAAQTSDGAAIVASPNPTDGPLYLELHNFIGESHFELFDAAGRQMIATTWHLIPYDTRQLSVDFLSPGVYFYRIRNGDQQVEGKLMRR